MTIARVVLVWLLCVACVVIVCEVRPSRAPRRAFGIALLVAAVCVLLT